MMDREREGREAEVAEERNPVRRGMIFNREVPVREARVEARPLLQETSKVNFGPIWVGFLCGIATLMVLGALATALGLMATTPGGPAAVIVAGIVTVLALFAGGYLCGYLLNESHVRFAAAHGFMVGALSLVLLVVFSTMGVTGLAASILGPLNIQNLLPAGVTASDVMASAAGWFTLSAILVLAASTLGGWAGCVQTRKELEV